MIPITVTTDYAASGDTLFVYRTGYVSPVTGRYREGESRDDGYRYTVRVDEGYKATVRIYYSDYIGENSSNRLMINGGGYAVGQTYLKTVYGGDTAHVELKSASNYTSDPGGSTLRCYFDIYVTYESWEPEPDLAVESCTVTPDSHALVDEPKRLEFAVVNRGGGTAGSTVAVVYNGDSPLARFDIPSLPTKARTSRELDITGLRVGEHTLCVRVDAVPGELETSNNEKSAPPLRVHARTPYTVRFDANGGVGYMPDQNFVFGTPQKLLPNAFVREGYLFYGWLGTGNYGDGQLVSNLDLDGDGIEVLRADWKKTNAESVYYSVENGTATITGVSFALSGELVIPDVIDGYRVTRIGPKAFYKNKNLTDVVIPSSVTEIGEFAFYENERLWSVRMSPNVTKIGEECFRLCSVLGSITLPPSLKVIPGSLFASCKRLEVLEIPEGVEEIGVTSLWGCESLLSLTIPSSVRNVGNGAFYRCSALADVTIRPGVTNFGANAFFMCKALSSVKFPEGVVSLGADIFEDCESLTAVSLPASLRTVGYGLFSGCHKLETVELAPGNASFTFVDGVLYDKGMKTLLACLCGRTKALIVPEGVTRIADFACTWCDKLRSVQLPSTLTDIGVCAFSSNDYLRYVVLPPSLRSMGSMAFAYCDYTYGVFFRGNAPETEADDVFEGTAASLYAPPGSTGWGASLPCSWNGRTVNVWPSCCFLRYDFRGGEPGVDAPGCAQAGETIDLSPPEKKGCVFAGWTVTGGIDPAQVEFAESSVVIRSVPTAGCEVKLTANWKTLPLTDTKYALRLLPGNGTSAGVVSACESGRVYKLPTNPFACPSGKCFAGWICSKNGKRYDDGMLVFNLAEPGETVTMTAIWE